MLNELVTMRFTEAPLGRICAVSLGPYVAGTGYCLCS
jgi:hypothetical protein